MKAATKSETAARMETESALFLSQRQPPENNGIHRRYTNGSIEMRIIQVLSGVKAFGRLGLTS
jgi:hypothetical protein